MRMYARNIETHVAIIDLEKAYDSMPVSQLWKTMKDSNNYTKLYKSHLNVL